MAQPAVPAKLEVGQKLQAAVLKIFPQQNLAQLNLNGSLVRAHSPNNLAVGQLLTLEVIKSGPVPQLKIIPASINEDIVARQTRQLLPKQQSIVNLQNRLLALTHNGTNLSSLPKTIHPLVFDILNGLPHYKDLIRPEILKQAIRNSGLFWENNLINVEANSPLRVNQDTKAKLLRLNVLLKKTVAQMTSGSYSAQPSQNSGNIDHSRSTAIQSTKPAVDSKPLSGENTSNKSEIKGLLAASESALAKITMDQLASLPQKMSNTQSWQLELPFRFGSSVEVVGLRVVGDDKKTSMQQATPQQWSVELKLKPPGLKTINCKLVLCGAQLDTFFRSESDSTATKITNHLSQLKARFEKAGLNSRHIESTIGRVPDIALVNLSHGLLNENA